MPRDNITHFIAACADDSALERRLAEAERSPRAWAELATEVGFDFTAEELHALVEKLIRAELRPADVIPSLLAATAAGGLADSDLENVTGGTSHDLGSWAKSEGLDVKFSAADMNTLLVRSRDST